MYDLIGDIHGYAGELKRLLHAMDYRESDGCWRHQGRKVIFVGDYIDRGPAIRETLHIIRSMVERGQAIALMGNHEYNALAYHTRRPGGGPLRSHNAAHTGQHGATLDQFAGHQREWADYLNWFYTLPLFLELPGLRAVHACWDAEHIDWLRRRGQHTMTPDFLLASSNLHTKENEVIEETLKGKEFAIPEAFAWSDKNGILRRRNRYRWWLDHKGITLNEFLFDCPPQLQSERMSSTIRPIIYPKEAPPVFFGHYWLEDEYPVVQAHNVICLDYSIGRKLKLVAYRWNGERQVDGRHFVYVNHDPKAGTGQVASWSNA